MFKLMFPVTVAMHLALLSNPGVWERRDDGDALSRYDYLDIPSHSLVWASLDDSEEIVDVINLICQILIELGFETGAGIPLIVEN